MSDLKITDFGVSYVYGRVIHWLASEFDKIIEIYKDKLPKKSLRPEYPKFLWMAPPIHKHFHDNTQCNKMGNSIKSTLDILSNHWMLRLKKFWDYNDSHIFKNSSFTEEGSGNSGNLRIRQFNSGSSIYVQKIHLLFLLMQKATRRSRVWSMFLTGNHTMTIALPTNKETLVSTLIVIPASICFIGLEMVVNYQLHLCSIDYVLLKLFDFDVY